MSSSRPAVLVSSLLCGLRLRRRGFRGGPVSCEGSLPVVHGGGRVRVGRLSLRGRITPVEIGAESGGQLEIGERAFVNQGATIVAERSIRIGDDARIGDYVAIYDSDYHRLEQGAAVRVAPVAIGDNVWLGRGVTVLPGVTIGSHSVVAAGSVVTGDLPARVLAAGVPAKPIRELEAAEDWRRE